MTTRLLPLPALLLLTVSATGCDSSSRSSSPERPTLRAPVEVPRQAAPVSRNSAVGSPAAAGLLETFDSGTKGSYDAADENLTTGRWRLDETLIGKAAEDHKTGPAALRMKPDGRAQMLFDVTGAVRVTVRAGAYGKDAGAPWQLQMSENQGRSWQTVGATQTAPAGKMLREASFVVAPKAAVRFALKHAGAEGRINFDDFRIELNTSGATAVVVLADTKPELPPKATSVPAPTSAGTGDAGGSAPIGTVRNRLNVNHLAFGNPSNATSTDPTNYLLQRPEYTLSFNRGTNTANWVSWNLSNRWKGRAARTPNFSPDDLLPTGWPRVTTADYSGSGFDRGHMCPSDDRDFSATENATTFRLTNIIPQAPANNQGPWRELEEYARTLAERGSELYVVAGPAGQGGAGTNGPATTIGHQNQIVVPRWTWKIIAVVPRNTATGAVPVPTRVIAIQMPNDQSVEHHHWYEYRVSVAQLEKLTGYDFFRTLPPDAQRTLEARTDDGPTR